MMKPICWLVAVILAAPLLIWGIIDPYHPTLFFIGNIELFVISVIVTVFVIVYSRRNWRANPYGRALMYSKVSLALLANLSFFTGLLGSDFSYRGITRIFLFTLILLAQARLLHLLFHVRNAEARHKYDIEYEMQKEKEGN